MSPLRGAAAEEEGVGVDLLVMEEEGLGVVEEAGLVVLVAAFFFAAEGLLADLVEEVDCLLADLVEAVVAAAVLLLDFLVAVLPDPLFLVVVFPRAL